MCREDLFVGQKFRYDHLCRDCDEYVSDICAITNTITLTSLTHPHKTGLHYSHYDKYGFGIKIVSIESFLEDCNKDSWNKPIPYRDSNNRF